MLPVPDRKQIALIILSNRESFHLDKNSLHLPRLLRDNENYYLDKDIDKCLKYYLDTDKDNSSKCYLNST